MESYQLTIFYLVILKYLNYLHQQSLSKCLTFKHVSVVFNNFTLLLIHGLSTGIVLAQQEKTPQKILWDENRFMEDSRMAVHVWVIDIVFLMDRTQELNPFNLKLQGPASSSQHVLKKPEIFLPKIEVVENIAVSFPPCRSLVEQDTAVRQQCCHI